MQVWNVPVDNGKKKEGGEREYITEIKDWETKKRCKLR